MTHEESRCMSKLTELVKKVDDILSLFGDQRILTGNSKRHAQELLEELKMELKKIYHTCDTEKLQSELTETDLAFLCPAVHEGMVEISVKYNSVPDGQWYDQLYSSRGQLQYYLYDLCRATEK